MVEMNLTYRRWLVQVCIAVLSAATLYGAVAPETKAATPTPLLLDGGRRLEYVRSFTSETEVRKHKSWITKVVDFLAGPPEVHGLVRPYGVATDAQGRIIVTDPGAHVVHVFDFKKQKYRRLEGGKEEFKSPIGIAVDSQDNLYVTDAELGKIFVFDSHGKFRRYIGNLKGEGYFKRPTGIAIDSIAKRLYVTDTLKNAVYTLDLDGNVLGHFGKRGAGQGEFNFPTEILAVKDELIVVDAMNFRVQIFDRNGGFKASFGQAGNSPGSMFRSKGIAADEDGNFYLADAFFDCVQAFNRSGQLLYFFGQPGSGAMQFQAPAGVHIDRDEIYVVDSANHRVQQFHYVSGAPKKNTPGAQ